MTNMTVNIHLKQTTITVNFKQSGETSCLSIGSTDDYNQVNIFMTMDQLKGVITDLQRYVTPPEPDYSNDDYPDSDYNERAEQMP